MIIINQKLFKPEKLTYLVNIIMFMRGFFFVYKNRKEKMLGKLGFFQFLICIFQKFRHLLHSLF